MNKPIRPCVRLDAILGLLAARPDARTLAAQLFAAAVPDDIAPYSDQDLARLATAGLAFLKERRPGRPKIHVMPAEGGVTIVEIVNDDMPFLVDSTLQLLAEKGYEIRLVLHPILSLKRLPSGVLDELAGERRDGDGFIHESFIHVHLAGIIKAARRTALEAEIAQVLADVRIAVLDWHAMLARLRQAVADYQSAPPPVPVEELTEAISFLQWLSDNHFTLLGVREYTFEGGAEKGELKPLDETGLGILRNPDTHVLRRGTTMVSMTPEIRAFLLQPAPLIITKADSRSSVHRRVTMDYIGIKQFERGGGLIGELRAVGLFTSSAYTRSPREIPLIRRKIASVIANSGFSPNSHSGKGLLNVLEHFPRDEMFQIEIEHLGEMARGILQLEERPRTRVFVRRDRFDRFVSSYVFIPRDRFNTDVRLRVGEELAEAFCGQVASFAPYFDEGALVRVHFIIARQPGKAADPDISALEARIVEIVRSWDDRLAETVTAALPVDISAAVVERYHSAFSIAYQAVFTPGASLQDIRAIEGLGAGDAVAVEFYRIAADGANTCRLKLYHYDDAIPLSGRLPILENMGLLAIEESTFTASPHIAGERRTVYIHEVMLETGDGAEFDVMAERRKLEDCFLAVWTGCAENDRFNTLVLKQDLGWRDVALLRAMARYLRQAGIAYSPDYIATTLVRHGAIAHRLVDLFHLRFDTARTDKAGHPLDKAARKPGVRKLSHAIVAALADVPSLDEDRIIRRLLNLVRAIVRTNYYQPAADGGRAPTIAIKIDSAEVDDLPEPRPFVEIFVYAPDVEGVHLRGGRIARGGLRWSDRPEDFRTEVLGLAKAQNVKNAVIVPVGAKGGFVPKRLPQGGSREEIFAEGTRVYKLFVSALLDLTDNVVAGQVVPPHDVVRHDGDDPYLVVAADKGTATFSDTANALSLEHGFWLDDAFASGGSAGYDHKKMGITARGVWEAVKRHFREIDIDIQASPFTVIGVGDMSGDVFGNGMLQSRQTRLLAAFDHRDIFIDPDPDAAVSFAERERLFKLARSSWQDYDKSLISKGGGVFSRQLKSITLTAQMKKLTGLATTAATPAEIINALLKAEIDLMWFGGIGTYVRASGEANPEVGDRANDGVRITARELRARVVGEGANLGLTQRARIEFALGGGRINNDAVDNSAGVNSSDVEVNVKIALGAAEAAGRLKRPARNKLLAAMTDEVADLVLRNNYQQTLCLSLAEARGLAELGYNARLMRALEAGGLLHRQIEVLPDDAALAERETAGAALTRPELAVLMAYAKIDLFDHLLASGVTEDPYLEVELFRYFPAAMQKTFVAEISSHKLHREIIATRLANSMINRGGPSFISRLAAETGRDTAAIARAFVLARDTFDLVALNDIVDAQDTVISGKLQIELYLDLQTLLRRATIWFLRNEPASDKLGEQVARYGKGIAELRESLSQALPPAALQRVSERARSLSDAGMPAAGAERQAQLRYLQRGPDIIYVASRSCRPIADVARIFFESTIDLGVDRLVAQANAIEGSDFFERLAVNRIIDTLFQTHRAIVTSVLAGNGKDQADWQGWAERRAAAVARIRASIDEFTTERSSGLARLTIAASQLAELAV
jgi:glutamate dehydrogenase